MRLEKLAREFEPERLTGKEAVELVEQLGVIHRLVDGMLAKAGQRIGDTRAFSEVGDRDAASLCGRLLGSGVRDARRAIETARKLDGLPATGAAVRKGSLSSRQTQMIADAATINPEAELDLIATAPMGLAALKDACISARTVVEDREARAKRQHASRCLRMWRGDDGMIEGRFRLPPEIGGGFKTAIDAATQKIFRARHTEGSREAHDRYAADALVAAVLGDVESVESAGHQRSATGVGAYLHVVIDHEVLVLGRVCDGQTCEIPGVGPVSVEWARSLLGRAFVTAVVKKGKDITTVAHFGRRIPAELQTAMLVGGRECDVENCDVRGYLERDHCEIDFADGGPAAYWNLAWLCYLHHLRKSQGWNLGPPDPVTGKRRLTAPRSDESAAA
jgi:Domain of unknown function (DUF222)